MIPANTMDTDHGKFTVEVEGMPSFEVTAAHPAKFPHAYDVRVETTEPGEKLTPANMTISYVQQGEAAHEFLKEWRKRVEAEHALRTFSTRAHRRGATLIYHTGIADVEWEFPSLRTARVYGKKHTMQYTIM